MSAATILSPVFVLLEKNVSQKYTEKRPSENSMRYHPDTL